MFFKRKKQKENKQLDEAFARVEKELERIDNWENPRKLEQYILDSCEQIITMTRETESQKNQYRILTRYLTDIKKIRSMTTGEINELKDVIAKLEKLHNSKIAYQEREPRLTDDQFLLMEEHEQTILEDIHRMQENEIYQTKVERDMRYLESEKSRHEIEKDEYSDAISKLRILSVIIFTLTLSAVIAGFIMQSALNIKLQLFITITLFVGAAIVFGLFLFSNAKRTRLRETLRNLNQTISLLNVVRMKYANVTKAIKYEQESYQVISSQEIHYMWGQYMLMIKEQEKFFQDNIDFDYYTKKFRTIIQNLSLEDEKIWMTRARAMVNSDELEKVNHQLILRRQKVRERISENTALIKKERDEIDRLMREHDYYVPEIMEIITSVDKMCNIQNLDIDED